MIGSIYWACVDPSSEKLAEWKTRVPLEIVAQYPQGAFYLDAGSLYEALNIPPAFRQISLSPSLSLARALAYPDEWYRSAAPPLPSPQRRMLAVPSSGVTSLFSSRLLHLYADMCIY